jgi:hypothetical protein
LWSWSLTIYDHDELTQAIPELIALRSVAEHNDWHNDDAFQQSLQLFEWAKRLPVSLLEAIDVPEGAVRAELASIVDRERGRYTKHELLAFAALIHDVGKAETFQTLPGGRTRCPGHEGVSARMAPDLCARFGFSEAEIHYITTLVGAHGEPYALFKELVTLPISEQQERLSCFEAEYAPHSRPLLLLAWGDLVTSDLQTNQPEKYSTILQFYQRWLCSDFRGEQADSRSKDDL